MKHVDPDSAPAALRRMRPRRLRQASVVAAAVVAVAFVASGMTLTGTTAYGGRLFDADSWALAATGVALAAVVLAPLRVRVDADADEVRVRNILRDVTVPWSAVTAVRYRRGTPWASLELITDELVTVLAVQVFDGQRAVDATRRLRALHAASRAAPPANGTAP